MAFLFRVFPYLPKARPHEPGDALYLPSQGGGRIDNPALYSVLYLSSQPSGAVAEAFGRFPEWSSALLEGNPSLPGSVRALARYRLPDDAPVCDLDTPAQLIGLGLRPSDVVGRDYEKAAPGPGVSSNKANGPACAGGLITILSGRVSVSGTRGC